MDTLFHVATCNKCLTSCWVALALLSRFPCLLLVCDQEVLQDWGLTPAPCVCAARSMPSPPSSASWWETHSHRKQKAKC